MSTTLFVPSAEAAFIAGLTDRQMNRIVDEHLVPEPFFKQQGNSRLFTRLGAAFAKFYFATEDLLLASARKQVLDELSARVNRLQVKDQILALTLLDSMSWKVERKFVEVDVLPFLQEAFYRANEVDQADALVNTDPEIMNGLPVFAGTRVSIGIVLGSLAEGISMDRLKASYPFLTEAHVQSAKVYEAVHPRRGRPRRMADVNPGISRRITHMAKRTVSA
ncbi:hypothetical protein B9Z51_15530 [Limnohabitans sp. T6-5]|uniref:DUF433 domain-containing protein n=1 Tax=Limnohabitans sp. T6-5 TaxID=1100724 RepID=UPI000D33B235|nr:DUF433 domain-containing protein [Limnohabitans sp. T6-5]PUE06490.1 hypothetical protein B9Z51_15530 [Limnohabitans sp. T6-5]